MKKKKVQTKLFKIYTVRNGIRKYRQSINIFALGRSWLIQKLLMRSQNILSLMMERNIKKKVKKKIRKHPIKVMENSKLSKVKNLKL